MLPKTNRLTDDYKFRALKKYGTVTHTSFFVLSAMPNKEGKVTVGFIASSKVGGAVLRNRAVRVLREAVRSVLPDIVSGVDMVFVAKPKLLEKKTQDILPVVRSAINTVVPDKYARIQDDGGVIALQPNKKEGNNG